MNRSRIGSLILWVICCVPFFAVAQEHQLSSTERERLLDGQFKLVWKTEGIPANIKQAFSKISRQSSFAMADPGQKFQLTDVVIDRALPFRRLVFAGTQDGMWFVHYERGGYGHSVYVIAFKVNNHAEADFIWGCGVTGIASSLDQLRKMVSTCPLARTDSYW